MSVNLGNAQPAKGYAGEPRVAYISFAPNGTSDPATASNTGPRGIKNFTTTYAATGQYTITFPADFAPPSDTTFVASAQPADLTNWFAVTTIGAYNATTRQLVVQAHRSGTGQAVAAAAGARIHVAIHFNDSSGA
jgi:hypothetical protein